MVAVQFKDHSFDVTILLVPLEETQAFVRIAPLQNLNRFRARAPGIHLVRRSHVKIDRVPARERPAVIVYLVHLPG